MGRTVIVKEAIAIIKKGKSYQVVKNLIPCEKGRVLDRDRELAKYAISSNETYPTRSYCLEAEASGLIKADNDKIIYLARGEKLLIPDDCNELINRESVSLLEKGGLIG